MDFQCEWYNFQGGKNWFLGDKIMLDITMMCDFPKSHSTSTDIQYTFGIKCYEGGH